MSGLSSAVLCWMAAGIVESLRKLLKDEDVTVRHKSTECIYVMACEY